MNVYRAVISGGSQLAEQPVILEQHRVCLSAQLLDHAIQWAFQYAAEDGVDAERNPYQVNLQVNEQTIAIITLDVRQQCARIARADGKSMILRTMDIAD